MISKGLYKLCRLIFTISCWTFTLPVSWNNEKQYPVLSRNFFQRTLYKLNIFTCILGSTFTLSIMLYNIITRVKEPSLVIYGIFLCSGIGGAAVPFIFMWFHCDEIIWIMGGAFQCIQRLGKVIVYGDHIHLRFT